MSSATAEAEKGGKRGLEGAEESRPRKIAKKVFTRALVFGYLGTGYHGSQKQGNGIRTIEGEIERAMTEVGIWDEGESVKWTRAARTDKGVHAVGNLVTVTVSDEIDEDKLNAINDKLKNMKIFFAHKVTNRFDARLQCDKRRYEYLLPKNIYAMAPTAPGAAASGAELESGMARGWEDFKKKFETAFGEYKGTHNFHNFTSGIVATDPQAMRYIISAEVVEVDEKFFKVVLVGQSFLFNQIRKLVACAIEYGLDRVSLEDIRKFLRPDFRKNLRMAPADGLLLDRLFYNSYDEHKCNYKDILPIAWSLKEADERIEQFKREVIYPEVVSKLPEVIDAWIKSLDDEFPEDDAGKKDE